jgi:glycosyltransferase involved in cell wall biosynthesis
MGRRFARAFAETSQKPRAPPRAFVRARVAALAFAEKSAAPFSGLFKAKSDDHVWSLSAFHSHLPEFRPRVLMLTWEFPPRLVGGLGVACAGLARALETRLDLRVIVPDAPEPGPYTRLYDDGLAARIDDFTVRALESVNQGGRPDLIHAHDWMTFPAAERVARRTGVPMIAHVHSLESDRAGGGPGNPVIREIEARGLRAADRVVAVSRKTAADAAREYGLDPKTIDVVWNGVDPVRPWRAGGVEKRVVFLGRMTAQKAPERFLRIAARVAATRPEVRFTMAGRGELRESLQTRVRELGLDDVVEFPDFLERPAVRALLARSSVCAVTSLSEPFGLVALEAAQFGVPAVVFPGTGAREVLFSARVAHDEDAFAAVVGELLDDDAGRARRGERAMAEAALMTWDRAAARILEIYRATLSEASPTPPGFHFTNDHPHGAA